MPGDRTTQKEAPVTVESLTIEDVYNLLVTEAVVGYTPDTITFRSAGHHKTVEIRETFWGFSLVLSMGPNYDYRFPRMALVNQTGTYYNLSPVDDNPNSFILTGDFMGYPADGPGIPTKLEFGLSQEIIVVKHTGTKTHPAVIANPLRPEEFSVYTVSLETHADEAYQCFVENDGFSQ